MTKEEGPYNQSSLQETITCKTISSAGLGRPTILGLDSEFRDVLYERQPSG
jgi:hypothetical protein